MNLCVECARMGRGCCESTDVLLTDGDIRRVSAATGRSDFWERRVPVDPYHLTPQASDPRWLLYTVRSADRTRVQLRHQPSGACVFLSQTGCTLDRDTRPLTCRLYPHDYDEQDLAGAHNSCPTELLAPGQDRFAAIGMRREDGEPLRQQLYEELRAGSVYRENCGDAVAASGRERP